MRKRAWQGSPRLVNEALLYYDDAQLSRVVRSFVAAAHAAGEPVLVALPTHNVEVVLPVLGPLTRAVRFEDMAVVGHNPSCVLDLYREWIDGHDGPVRLVGELTWPGRSHPEVIEALRHEALVNHELADCEASILCPFDAGRLEPETLLGAEMTHPRLVQGDGTRRPSPRYCDPAELYDGRRWPQAEPTPPVSDLDFDGDLGALRRAVSCDAIVGALDGESRADLVFAVNEVATSAVRHGDGHCRTRIWRDGSTVVVELCCPSILVAAAGRLRPAPDSPDGRGLWLINHLCDLVELRSGDGGATVRLHARVGLADRAMGMSPLDGPFDC